MARHRGDAAERLRAGPIMIDARPSILVVEDENVVAKALVSSLENLRYPVVGVAASGEEAVALAGRAAPGLVLMDIHLGSGIDGIQAAQEIQKKLFIPVVFLTTYSDQAALERARLNQPFGYVVKPFEDREVEVAIQIALYRHRMETALRDSERRLDAILTSIGDAVIVADIDRRVTFINRAGERLLGWSSERGQGRLLSELLTTRALAGGLVGLARDRDLVPLDLVESPVLDAGGKLAGYVVVARDVSERLRAQEAHDRELVERAARAAAEREHERARVKSEISLGLADVIRSGNLTEALRRAARLLVKNLADWCVIHLEQEGAVRISAHSDPDKEPWLDELLRRWPPDPARPQGRAAVMRSGRPEVVERVSDDFLSRLAREPDHLELLRKLGFAAYVCVPLRTRQGVIGTVTLVSGERRPDGDASDATFAQQVADRIALAIENARLYREAQEATVAAERLVAAEQRARADAEALFRVADALSEAQLDLEALVQRVTDQATALVGARFGAFFYNHADDRGESYLLYTLSGAPKEAFEQLGLPRATPFFAPTFSGQGVIRVDDASADPRYGQWPPHHGMPEGHLSVTSYLAVPVVSRTGQVMGGLFFGHPEPARFTEQHERMARALAAHAAVAIENARLFAATRSAEERQSRLVRDLERTVRFSEMFVGILGHDLRNPLSAITTGASVVLHRAESDRVTRPISRILSSADRMSRMIDQILDFTRIRLGRGIPLRCKPVDLAEVCRAVLDELKGDVEDGAQLEVRGDPVGTWDEDRLSQLASNLAGNALQHRRRGTPIALTIDGTGADRVTLAVQNQGAVPPEILPVLFEPMRGSETWKREGSSGLGLGLYISQQIAEAHGGSIRVASEPESGTRFTVDLPREALVGGEPVFDRETNPGQPRE
jgi:signal transduction histidine kinase/CheY-like chemotaxis protein